MRQRGRSWQVDYGTQKGKRTQRSFKTLELARIDIDEHKRRESLQRQEVKTNAVTLYHLTQRERADVLEAIEILKDTTTLKEAASFFVRQNGRPADSCTVNVLLPEYKQAKRKANCREWHLRTIDYRIGKFYGQQRQDARPALSASASSKSHKDVLVYLAGMINPHVSQAARCRIMHATTLFPILVSS
jgi:hypothetical protein